ncbi:MAG: DNA repair protein RecO, partial [Clostridia bacterium]
DYGENDKIVLLYSLEEGKFSVTAKGVKKATAKLKYAVEPFCFGNFTYTESHDRRILTGCEQEESFFALRENLEKYYGASACLEVVGAMEQENESNPSVFVLLLRALKEICFGQIDVYLAIVKFYLEYLTLAGYRLDFSKCGVCGSTADRRLYLDLQIGGVVCAYCRSGNAIAISPSVKNALTLISRQPFNKLSVLKLNQSELCDCLDLFNSYICHSFTTLKCLKELIKLPKI